MFAVVPPGLEFREEFVGPQRRGALLERGRTPAIQAVRVSRLDRKPRDRVVRLALRLQPDAVSRRRRYPISCCRCASARQDSQAIGSREFEQALVIRYGEGAGIGWHRDRPVFDRVFGLSLLSPCMLRFRRRRGADFERFALGAPPRSAYLLERRDSSRVGTQHRADGSDALLDHLPQPESCMNVSAQVLEGGCLCGCSPLSPRVAAVRGWLLSLLDVPACRGCAGTGVCDRAAEGSRVHG